MNHVVNRPSHVGLQCLRLKLHYTDLSRHCVWLKMVSDGMDLYNTFLREIHLSHTNLLHLKTNAVVDNFIRWCGCYCRYCRTGSAFYGDKIRRYVEFDAEDNTYDIMQHFNIVYDVIEEARKSGGRALIHCIMGVNRSGALAVAYTMVHQQWGPITSAVYVRQKRRMLLSNEHFQELLIEFARQRNLLHLDAKEIHGSKVKS